MFRLIPLFAIAALAFVSCERRSDIEIANEQNILIIGNSNEPKGLDPHLVSGVLESNIIRALFEGLVSDHPSKDSHSVDGIAYKDQIEHSDDFTEWTFHLNPNAKWSDGVTVTADDFTFSYKRLLSPDPNWPAKYAEMLYFLKNGEAYHRSKFGHILCGNDPEFPLDWEILQKANFDGDSKITPKKFKDKEFSDLNEQDLKKFSSYLADGETPDFSALNAEDIDFETLPVPSKKVLFNSLGIDRLGKEQLIHLKDNLDLIKWSDDIPNEVKQLVITRLLAHHDAGKPNLWERAQVGVKAIDDHTLQLNLRGPTPYLLEVAKHYTWYPVPKHTILKHGEINTAYSSPWTKPGNIVSNGPFKLKSWRTNHFLEVERNPHYWDAKEVKLDGIRYLPISNYYT
ncbi:ABC transporter substrate-binding protein, partial [Akkermansiaceae bacterium]|nr:ABC transporter substrate-binding protein [Akkermansiaceae bacterium]